MRTYKRDLYLGIRFFHRLRELAVTFKSGGAGEQHHKLVLLHEFNGVSHRNVVGRRIKQTRTFQHAGRICQPHRIPVGFDFAGCGPAGAGATIKVFKRRRIEKKRS